MFEEESPCEEAKGIAAVQKSEVCSKSWLALSHEKNHFPRCERDKGEVA